jgi:hypothetical protein
MLVFPPSRIEMTVSAQMNASAAEWNFIPLSLG